MLATRSASWPLAVLERLGLRCLLPPCAERMLRMWTSVALKKATMKGCLLWGPLRPTSPATHGLTLWPAGGDREMSASMYNVKHERHGAYIPQAIKNLIYFLLYSWTLRKTLELFVETLPNPTGWRVKKCFMEVLWVPWKTFIPTRQIMRFIKSVFSKHSWLQVYFSLISGTHFSSVYSKNPLTSASLCNSGVFLPTQYKHWLKQFFCVCVSVFFTKRKECYHCLWDNVKSVAYGNKASVQQACIDECETLHNSP